METIASPVSQSHLEKVFESFRGQKLLFVTPGGNWGDYLIYAGAEAIARRYNIEVITTPCECLHKHAAHSVAAVYIHGSGGFNQWTSGRASRSLFTAIREFPVPIIQGPVTLSGSKEYLSALNADLARLMPRHDVIFLVRESTSLDNLRRYMTVPWLKIEPNQDTALYLVASDLVHDERRPNGYALKALRADNERSGEELNVAKNVEGVDIDPATYARSFNHWVRIHAGSRFILTNRTHSAIAGAILGIPTAMFASSYHKNRSVWEYSLRARGVIWVGDKKLGSSSLWPPVLEKATKRQERFASRIKERIPKGRILNTPVAQAGKAIGRKVWNLNRRLENNAHRIIPTCRGVPWE